MMNANLTSRLRCPSCKGSLRLEAFSKGGADQIVDGILLCDECKFWYPIHSSIPVLLKFHTPFHDAFFHRNSNRMDAYREFTIPTGKPRNGEKSVQETFSDEWECVKDDPLSFTYSPHDLRQLNTHVWLKWAHNAHEIETILEIGCGMGQETWALHECFPNSEVFAIDLNFALFHADQKLKVEPRIHLIIASLFDLPFDSAEVDLLYSQGVIHHTYSTLDAFRSISRSVKPNRYFFIWVYGLDDHLALGGFDGFLSRVSWRVECLLRPIISRSPKLLRDLFFLIITILAHPFVKLRVRQKQDWKLKNTNHSLRDWLSPRFAHRHSYNEVIEWYEESGFEIVDIQSPSVYRRLFNKRLWGVGMTGRRKAT